MSDYWILDDANGAVRAGLVEWSAFFSDTDRRRVGGDTVDGVFVSTVFLGVDHNWGSGEPLLFETMLFNHNTDGRHGDLDGAMARYSTWQQAKAAHEAVVADLRATCQRTCQQEGDS